MKGGRGRRGRKFSPKEPTEAELKRELWRAKFLTELVKEMGEGKYKTFGEAARVRDERKAAAGELARGEEGVGRRKEPEDPVRARYSWIWGQLRQVKDVNRRMERMQQESQRAADRPAAQAAMEKVQKDETLLVWNNIERAVGEVAAKHGVEVEGAELPVLAGDVSTIDFRKMMGIIHRRMVVPMDEKMAGDVVEMLNGEYAKEKGETGK
jgi:hypothetical protein